MCIRDRVEESQTFGMEMDLVEGMRFDKGYISPYFVTDADRMEAVSYTHLRAHDEPLRQMRSSSPFGGSSVVDPAMVRGV